MGADGTEELVEVTTEVEELVVGDVHGFGHRELSVDHFEHHFPIDGDNHAGAASTHSQVVGGKGACRSGRGGWRVPAAVSSSRRPAAHAPSHPSHPSSSSSDAHTIDTNASSARTTVRAETASKRMTVAHQSALRLIDYSANYNVFTTTPPGPASGREVPRGLPSQRRPGPRAPARSARRGGLQRTRAGGHSERRRWHRHHQEEADHAHRGACTLIL